MDHLDNQTATHPSQSTNTTPDTMDFHLSGTSLYFGPHFLVDITDKVAMAKVSPIFLAHPDLVAKLTTVHYDHSVCPSCGHAFREQATAPDNFLTTGTCSHCMTNLVRIADSGKVYNASTGATGYRRVENPVLGYVSKPVKQLVRKYIEL